MRNGIQYGVTPQLTSINPDCGSNFGFMCLDLTASQTVLPLNPAGNLDKWTIAFPASFGGGFYLGMKNSKGKIGLSTTYVCPNCTTSPLCGKSWRIWPVTDSVGNTVANTFLLALDIQGSAANYDVSLHVPVIVFSTDCFSFLAFCIA